MISRMLAHDVEEVAAVAVRSMPFAWDADDFRDSLQADGIGWVMRQPNLVGFCLLRMIVHDEAEVLNIAIAPDHQGQGYGEALLRHAMADCVDHGAEVMHLEVRCSQQAAIGLYTKLGFNKVGERRDYYPTIDGREDAVCMSYRR